MKKEQKKKAEIIENLHEELKQIVGNLKENQKILKKLINDTKNVEAVLHSAIEDAIFDCESAISHLEEEIDS